MLRRYLLLLCLLLPLGAAAAAPPTPEQFLGFRVGTDRKLASWDQVLDYCRLLSRESGRVRYQELGKSTLGAPFALLEVSSPGNLARRTEIMAVQKRLASPYELEQEEADALMRSNPAVVLITMTIHSSEVASTQMSLELLHRLALEESPYIRNLLDNVYLLLVPSANPDGQKLIVDWYRRNVGGEYEYAQMPWLYHPYTGHDNNRDAFMLTQVESRYIARILYRDWFPVLFLDEHQMGNEGARVFVPPFEDPINQNQEPGVIALSSLMGMHMFNALNQAGLPGAVYGEKFAWWWQGSAKNGAWWHNMVGLLSEVASAALASPVEQQRAELYSARRKREEADTNESRRLLPPPQDTWPRGNYPNPWLGGTWRLRDIVDYELVFTFGLLEGCAAHRIRLQDSFYSLNRKNIERGRAGSPFAAILPAEQHDPTSAARMIEALQLAAIEIYRAEKEIQAGGVRYPAGSLVIPMAQPFRNYVKDLLERQNYPVRPPRPGESPDRPYDVTGWTLPFQMGVRVEWISEPFDLPMERLTAPPYPAGVVHGKQGAVYLAPREWNRSALLVNLLLQGKGGEQAVSVSTAPFQAGGRSWAAGAFILRPAGDRAAEQLKDLLPQVHVDLHRVDLPPGVAEAPLKMPRLGLYQPWTANMDEGWTRFVLEQFGFTYRLLHNEEIKRGDFRGQIDVLLLPSQSRTGILRGSSSKDQRPEYRGGIEEEGEKQIAGFVREGGTLIALENAGSFAVQALNLPVRDVLAGLPAAQFYSPGGILRGHVDTAHPVGYGMQSEQGFYFTNSPAYAITGPLDDRAVALVRYPQREVLMSGYLLGEEFIASRAGALAVKEGKGRVVLFGFRPQFRAQSHGAFKMLFNAIYWSAQTAR